MTRTFPACLLFLCLLAPAGAALKHRYTFNASVDGVQVADLAGGQHGTLQGSGYFAEGQLHLSGEGYVDLPNGLISQYSNATFEIWFTSTDFERSNRRLFDFGSNVMGEGQAGVSSIDFLALIPHSGHGDEHGGPFFWLVGGASLVQPVHILTYPAQFQREYHVVVAYDASRNISRLYLDGKLMATGNAEIPLTRLRDINNWLARSNWGEPPLPCRLNEFRIHDSILEPEEVLASYESGPDPDLLPSGFAPIQSLEIRDRKWHTGFNRLQVVAKNSAGLERVVSAHPGLQLSFSDSARARRGHSGTVAGLSPGPVTVTATLEGKTASRTLTVFPAPSANRYAFNDPAGAFVFQDLKGGAHGTAAGGAVLNGTELELDGINGYGDLPNGRISGYRDVTIETWITWHGRNLPLQWQRVFDFGSSVEGEGVSGNGRSDFMLVASHAFHLRPTFFMRYTRTGGMEGVTETPTTAGVLPMNEKVHLAVSYHRSEGLVHLYTNGVHAGSGRLTPNHLLSPDLRHIEDVNCWLGRSQFIDVYFWGKYDEFRIYPKALRDFEIAQSFTAGPNQDGPLEGLTVQLERTTLRAGSELPVAVIANYTHKTEEVTAHPSTTFTSSHPGVARVEGGVVKALTPGTAVITVRHGAAEEQLTLRVFEPAPLRLKHRYGFSEPMGAATARDSVGSADGTRISQENWVDFDGTGGLLFQGVEGYLDLPNRLVSGLQSVTWEAWLTWHGDAGYGSAGQVLFDFGSSDAGEGASGTRVASLAFELASTEGVSRFMAVRSGLPVATVSAPPVPAGSRVHLVVTYDPLEGEAVVYMDGSAAGSFRGPLFALQELNDLNNWIGKSNGQNAPPLAGLLEEFRIYEGGLTPEEVNARFLAGPDRLPGLPEVIRIASIAAGPSTVILEVESEAAPEQHAVHASSALGSGWQAVSGVTYTPLSPTRFRAEFPRPAGGAWFYRLEFR